MHRNPLWLIFLGVIGCCIAGYTGFTFYKIFLYTIHSKEVDLKDVKWKAVWQNGSFAVDATYHYSFQGRDIESHSQLQEKLLNRWAADEKIASLQKQHWHAWIDPRNPSDSALQKNFPLKECISTAILWSILAYFLWLGFYVAKKYGKNHSQTDSL